jgi:Protein of unknown function (DUF3298)/Deacetylase PdaC
LKIKISTPVALILLLLTLTFGLSANLANAQESASTHLKGSIGESRFEMTLKREGDQLQGSYFYVKSGSANQLSLRGKINADGTFTMQEFDSSGRQTGEFKGTWKNDPNESGASLEGEWKKPGAKDGEGFSASEQMLFFTNGTQITDGHVNESIKAKRVDLTAEYPELTGAANAAGFNQLVKSRVTKELADFRKQMMSLSAEDLKMLPAGVNNYIEISYNIEYADNNLISVSFLEGTFGGGVHPNYNYFTITYDLKNGREIKLSELFKPGANYLKAVSDYATRDLRGRKMPDSDENMGLAQDIFAEGATAKAENYRNWNLTKKGLMFTFDPYQVGPYAAGPQTVIVPYAELKAIARPGGPLELF